MDKSRLVIPTWLLTVLNEERAGVRALDRMLPPGLKVDFWASVRILDRSFRSFVRVPILLGLTVGVSYYLALLLFESPCGHSRELGHYRAFAAAGLVMAAPEGTVRIAPCRQQESIMKVRRVMSIVYAVLTVGVVAFQLALALGAPWGSYTMGGTFPGQLPPVFRALALVQAAVLLLAAGVVLARAGVALDRWSRASRWLIWLVVALAAVACC
jgi:hypothetical protein